MTTGAYISGVGHLALILWVILGGVLFRAEDPDVPDTANVQLLSESEFLSLTAARPEPLATQDVEAPQAPETEENTATASAGDAPPEIAPRPDIAPAAEPDPTPEAPDLSTPQAEVEEAVPDAPVAPSTEAMIALLPPTATPGRPQDAPRVAPTPTPETLPALQEAPEFVAPRAPEAESAPDPEPQPEEEEPPTAPVETTPEIVTEADQDEPEGARVSGFPPRLRPLESAPVAEATPAPEPAPAPQNDAGGSADSSAPPDPELPVGPPLSFGEVDRLVVAISQCWSIGTLSTDAARSTVVVGVSMKPDATPIASSIRLLASDGPDQKSIDTAFEYASRAIRRCGVRGFPLPLQKYAHWAEIEITFSPDEGLLFE